MQETPVRKLLKCTLKRLKGRGGMYSHLKQQANKAARERPTEGGTRNKIVEKLDNQKK